MFCNLRFSALKLAVTVTIFILHSNNSKSFNNGLFIPVATEQTIEECSALLQSKYTVIRRFFELHTARQLTIFESFELFLN